MKKTPRDSGIKTCWFKFSLALESSLRQSLWLLLFSFCECLLHWGFIHRNIHENKAWEIFGGVYVGMCLCVLGMFTLAALTQAPWRCRVDKRKSSLGTLQWCGASVPEPGAAGGFVCTAVVGKTFQILDKKKHFSRLCCDETPIFANLSSPFQNLVPMGRECCRLEGHTAHLLAPNLGMLQSPLWAPGTSLANPGSLFSW